MIQNIFTVALIKKNIFLDFLKFFMSFELLDAALPVDIMLSLMALLFSSSYVAS